MTHNQAKRPLKGNLWEPKYFLLENQKGRKSVTDAETDSETSKFFVTNALGP
jgi:hypothetical protein